jgi:hypothetical protein
LLTKRWLTFHQRNDINNFLNKVISKFMHFRSYQIFDVASMAWILFDMVSITSYQKLSFY